MELKGQKACIGKITGKAHVIPISDPDVIAEFEPGCILVTMKTTPDFITIFSKAAAIVTQVGGVLSHAAIVSREFNVPCIVGVNNLLRYVQSGDEITVDATTGIVTVVDRETLVDTIKIIRKFDNNIRCDVCGDSGHEPSDCNYAKWCENCDEWVHIDHEHEYCSWCDESGHDTSDCEVSKYCEECGEQVEIDHQHPYCEYCDENEHWTDHCMVYEWCEDCGEKVDYGHDHQKESEEKELA